MARAQVPLSLLVVLASASVVGMPAQSGAQVSRKADGPGNSIVGKQVFTTTCAACHGLDGGGGERGPNISRRREVQNLTDNALLQIVTEGVPETSMPPFASLGKARIQAVVRYLRTLQGQASTAPLPGSPDEGKALFFGKSGCSQCHIANGQGGFMASDLSSFAGTQSAADIRSAITEPNRNLDPRKRAVTVITAGGQTLTGTARNQDNFSLQLQTADGTLHLLKRSELRSIEYQPRSLMPDDYASRLSAKELDNLVSYLISAARNKDRAPAEPEGKTTSR